MRTLGAGAFAAAVYRGAEEVCPWVDARGVDVVVLGEVAHGGQLSEAGLCDLGAKECLLVNDLNWC